jgi:hypothetical protein
VADGELGRLRRLEENHLKELALLRTAEKEKVEDLSRRLTEVEKQRLALQEEVTTKTTELSATAKRWVDEIGALDRGLSGECISSFFLSLCRLSAVGCRLRLAAGGRNSDFFAISIFGLGAVGSCRLPPGFSFYPSEFPSSDRGQSALAGCRLAYFRTSKICIFQLISALMISDVLLLAAAFPETQDAALAAVGVARETRRRATGEGSSEYFTMEDYMASMAARVEPITKLGWELRKAAEELVQMLWPAEAVPQDLSNLISWLERAPDRFLDWKESATRAGADMALSFVLSWYNEVDLGQLEYRRAGVEDKLPAEYKTARLARASAIADFVDKGLFVADPNPPSDDEDEEMQDEEAEDAPGDDPAAGSAGAPPAGPPPAGA